MASLLVAAFLVLFSFHPSRSQDARSIWGPRNSATIGTTFAGSRATLTVTRAYAGAIASLRWRNKEFVNIFDHGRQMQSAASFDGLGECYNPTEAGSKDDGRGSTSSSKVIALSVSARSLSTTTEMAFWASPGGVTGGCPNPSKVRNSERVSDIVLSKTVAFGADGIPNVIDHDVRFRVPRSYKSAVFEALTAYLQPEFSKFWTFDPSTGARHNISNGPGEQNVPLIFSTPDSRFALGVYSAELPQSAWPNVGYGRFNFTHLKTPGSATVKWNCVFREKDIKPGDYSYRCTSIFGTLQDVEKAMMELHRVRGRKVQ